MNSLIKITSGKLRGRSIKSPNTALTHPMGSREKLALFNMIADYLPGAKVMDAYAGSGALGIEALSRGAKEAIFIEKDARACKTIRENLKTLGIEAKVLMMDVANYVSSEKFDVILVDPPYDKFLTGEMEHLSRNLKDSGVLVISHPNETPELPNLESIKTRKYAGANISIYRFI